MALPQRHKKKQSRLSLLVSVGLHIVLGVALFQTMGLSEMTHWAKAHSDIIARFGRFPHRNVVLGRVSTPAELAFLKAGGFSG